MVVSIQHRKNQIGMHARMPLRATPPVTQMRSFIRRICTSKGRTEALQSGLQQACLQTQTPASAPAVQTFLSLQPGGQVCGKCMTGGCGVSNDHIDMPHMTGLFTSRFSQTARSCPPALLTRPISFSPALRLRWTNARASQTETSLVTSSMTGLIRSFAVLDVSESASA